MASKQMIERAGKIKTGIVGAANEVISLPGTSKTVEYIARFLLGITLSAARLFGAYAPFGSAIVAVSGAKLSGALALLGSILGYLLLGGVMWGFRYAATSFLVFAANYVFKDTKLKKKNWFASVNAVFMMAVTGFPYVIDAGFDLRSVSLFVMELVLSGGCAYFYKIALSPWTPDKKRGFSIRHTISVLIMAITILAAFSNVRPIGGISVGRIIVCAAVMSVSYHCGAAYGCAAGVIVGIVMDASAQGGTLLFAAAYSLAALISAMVARKGKLPFILTYVAANAAAVIWFGGVDGIPALYECFCASVIFMLLTEKFAGKLAALFHPVHVQSSSECSVKYVQDRIQKLSAAFKCLYESVHALPEQGYIDVMSIFDRLPENCCKGCVLEKSCWERDAEKTKQVFSDAAPKMIERGKALKDDFSEGFRQKCISLDSLVASMNDELRLLMYRRQYKSRIYENKDAAHKQYAEMAAILRCVADDLNTGNGNESEIEVKLRKYLQVNSIDVCEDIYRDMGGRLRIEISGESVEKLANNENMLDDISEAIGIRLCEKRQVSDDSNRIFLMEAEPLAVLVGVAAIRKSGECVSGDRGTYFKTDEGVFYVVLSDGMGSGENAARESSGTIKVLESFLKAGLPPDMALSFLNTSMQLGGIDEPFCASIDIMGVNLFSGEMQLCKYGAAPTYIKNGKSVKRICGDSVAAGSLTGLMGSPDVVKMKLEVGSTTVITSDGVGDECNDDMWLRTMLLEYNGGSEKELARAIVQKSISLRGCEDDMTVLVVSMTERE